MGLYPHRDDNEFLKFALPLPNSNIPVIIFFHYNFIEREKYSDWWNNSDKELFYNTIKNNNILAIMHGHLHITSISSWKGIPVLNGSGNGIILICLNSENKVIETKIIKQ